MRKRTRGSKKLPLSIQFTEFSPEPNPQSNSPLFTILPNEIRNSIFSFTLMAHYDTTRAYKALGYTSRPGYRHPLKIDLSLLETCKLIYLETYLLPFTLNELPFWFDRGPNIECFHVMKTKTMESLMMRCNEGEEVHKVHLFTQMYWLEGDNWLSSRSFRPVQLRITIRHTDWWFWEENEPLRMSDNFLQVIESISTLQIFILELETMESLKYELRVIANHLRSKDLHINANDKKNSVLRTLSAKQTPIVETRWNGPTVFAYDAQVIQYDKEDEQWFYPTSVWEDPETLATGLVYYITTVKWTAI